MEEEEEDLDRGHNGKEEAGKKKIPRQQSSRRSKEVQNRNKSRPTQTQGREKDMK